MSRVGPLRRSATEHALHDFANSATTIRVQRDQALAALERGVDDGSQTIGFLNSEPGLDAVRNEPRFRAVSQRLGLG